MSAHDETTEAAVNRQAADITVMSLLIFALLKQVPDLKALLTDFSEMSEDTSVRTMNSLRPESFFQAIEQSRSTWLEILNAQRDSRLKP